MKLENSNPQPEKSPLFPERLPEKAVEEEAPKGAGARKGIKIVVEEEEPSLEIIAPTREGTPLGAVGERAERPKVISLFPTLVRSFERNVGRGLKIEDSRVLCFFRQQASRDKK